MMVEKLRIAISEITAVLGDSFEDAEIADALLYYHFDQEKAISWLLDGKNKEKPKAEPKQAAPPKADLPPQKKTSSAGTTTTTGLPSLLFSGFSSVRGWVTFFLWCCWEGVLPVVLDCPSLFL